MMMKEEQENVWENVKFMGEIKHDGTEIREWRWGDDTRLDCVITGWSA
jgi:hypothetical protein